MDALFSKELDEHDDQKLGQKNLHSDRLVLGTKIKTSKNSKKSRNSEGKVL